MRSATQRVFLLSGVIRCGECDRALIGQSAHGKNQVHRYYAHASNRKISPVQCSVKRYNADEVEKTLLTHLATDAKDPGYLEDLKTTIISNGESVCSEVKKEIQRIEKAIKCVETEIENVFRLQTENPLSASVREVITERLEKLSTSRKGYQDYLHELQHRQADLLDADEITTNLEEKLQRLQASLGKAEPAILRRLIRNMYDVIFLKEGHLEGFYLTAAIDNSDIQHQKKKKASGENPEAFDLQLNHQSFSGWHPSVPIVADWAEWWT